MTMDINGCSELEIQVWRVLVGCTIFTTYREIFELYWLIGSYSVFVSMTQYTILGFIL